MEKTRYQGPLAALAPSPPEPPSPPIYCGPPLPVAVPGQPAPPSRKVSLYRDLFGDDVSVLAEALNAPWASMEQRELAHQVLDGRKRLRDLPDQELELLDDLAHRYNFRSDHARMPRADARRVPVPDLMGNSGRVGESLPPERGDPMPSDFSSSYGWLEDDE